MTNLETQNNQQEVVFQIKEQRIDALDANDVEVLQNRFLVNFDNYSTEPPMIMKSNGIGTNSLNISNISISDNAYSKFPYFLKLIEVPSCGKIQYVTSKHTINSKKIILFQLNSVFLKDGIYYFYTSDGQILTADKQDFDNNGINANSLQFFGNQGDIDIFGNTQKKVYENGYEIRNNGNGFISLYEDYGRGNHVLDIPGDNIFKIDPTKILVSEGGYFNTYKIVDNNYKKGEIFDIPYKGVSQMAVDFNKNFLFIVNETGEGSTLHILLYNDFIEKKEIKEVYSIKNVKEICGLGRENGMICLMTDGSLKYYWNTFSKFKTSFFKGNPEKEIPGGKLIYPKNQEVTTVTDSTKTDLLEYLEGGNFVIDLNNNEEDKTNEIDRDIIDKIWNLKVYDEKTLKELFDSAKDEKSIEQVLKIFQKIQKDPQISKAGGLLKTIETQIITKKNEITLSSIFSELGEITAELGKELDLNGLITMKNRLYKIRGKRKIIQIEAGYTQQDTELKNLIILVEKKISEYNNEHKEEFESKINDYFENIKEILNNIDNSIDISSIYKNEIYKTIEEMISCLDVTGQKKYRNILEKLVDDRLKEIKKATETEKENAAKIIENKKNEVEGYIEKIKNILDDIDDISAIEQYKQNDVLVEKIKKLLEELPSSIAQTLNLKLGRVFIDRIHKLRLSGEEAKGLVQNLDSYGIDTVLYYDEDGSEKIEWKIEGKKNANGTISLVVKLMNGETHEYDESIYLQDAEKYSNVLGVNLLKDLHIKFDMTQQEYVEYQGKLTKYKQSGKKEIQDLLNKIKEETDLEKKKALQKKLKEIREYYKDARYTDILIKRLIKKQKLNPRSKIPPFDPNFIVLDEEREILKNLSTRLVDQKDNGGIDILEGGPGLGKTVMCEFLASVTNREIVRVQCSKMDPSDMFFSPTLKKGETSREPADWIKLMQKPGTIILFDEIDKLNDQCIERLHSLFDRSRSVYDPQLGRVKANHDCLFLGTRNSYDRMTNPILSRGRILQINYPGVLNESYKVSKYTDSSILKKMSFEEFSALYDKYITRSESAPNNAKERKIYDLVINIHHLLNVFTELRSLYDSDEPFAFEISYRDARQIFVDYNSSGDFKKSMESILIPKARGAVIDTEDKKTQEDMVRRAINKELPSSSL